VENLQRSFTFETIDRLCFVTDRSVVVGTVRCLTGRAEKERNYF
jgi:hypothetical protein